MRRLTAAVAALVAVAVAASPANAQTSGTPVSGVITSDATWTADGSPYVLTGDVVVDVGVTLTVAAGTRVVAAGNYVFRTVSGGHLNANGTEADPVVFTCWSPQPSCWAGIRLSSANNSLAGVDISYAQRGIGASCFCLSWLTLTNSRIHHNYIGIDGTYPPYSITNTLIDSNQQTGISATFSSSLTNVTHNTIVGNGRGLYVVGLGLSLNENNIVNSQNVYWYPGHPSSTLDFTNNWWGTTNRDAIASTIHDHRVNVDTGTVDFEPFANAPVEAPTTASLTAVVTGEGKITSDLPGMACSGSCSVRFREGSVVNLTASPADHWRFAGWGGACEGAAECDVVLDSDATVSAEFSRVVATHARLVTLRVTKRRVARGRIVVADSFAGCRRGVPVAVQRRIAGVWRTFTRTETHLDGTYERRLRKRGPYRAVAPRVEIGDFDICGQAQSSATRADS